MAAIHQEAALKVAEAERASATQVQLALLQETSAKALQDEAQALVDSTKVRAFELVRVRARADAAQQRKCPTYAYGQHESLCC